MIRALRLLPRGTQWRRGVADVAAPQQQQKKKEVSKHIGFYREFGRPLSKVFLMSFFAYQACYWAWLKLEKEEARRAKEGEVAGLMAEVERIRTAATAAGKK